MSNPVFYKEVVPLDKTEHGSLRLNNPDRPLAFAAGAQLIPAVIDEFEPAMRQIGIAFLPARPHPTAVFVCGVQPDCNLFINGDGLWKTSYVPAYLRRYPFIIGDTADGGSLLCMDMSYEGLSETDGEALFEDGEPAAPIERGMALAQGYQEAAKRTDAFCAALDKMDLLRPVSLSATLPGGEQSSVHGLMVVDEAALAELDGKALARLHKEGWLKVIYAHLFSLAALADLGGLADAPEAEGPAAADAETVS